MGHNKKTIITTGLVAGLGLAAIPALAIALGASSSASATGVSGAVRLNAEVATAIAMKIASPNDTNPDCMEQSGITYGVANRYATSNGAEGSKQVDTFDGTTGGADELNTNTSCATLTMTPNTFDTTYSDITIYTNSPNGYSLTVRSADNTSPNLVNTTDSTQYIPAGTLTEVDGTGEQAGQKVVPGGQNKWALKSDTGLLDIWTPVATTDTTVRSYDQETNNGSTTRVTYGISAGNNVAGKYATTLSYTATMFDTANPEVPTANFAIGTGGGNSGSGSGSGSGSSAGNTDPTAQITLPNKITVPYGETRTIPFTVNPGYEIDSITCGTGYECANYNTGSGSTGSQSIDITNNSKDNTGSIAITTKPIEYPVSVPTTSTDPNLTVSFGSDFNPADFTVPYNETKTIPVTFTVPTGYEPAITCGEGYTCTISEDPEHPGQQIITITNDGTLSGTSITFNTKPIEYPVSVTNNDPDLNLGELADPDFTVAYGESKTVSVTPKRGHEVVITCSEGYTCTTSTAPGTGTDPQNIIITNNNTTSNNNITITTKPIEYSIIPASDSENDTNTITLPANITVPYGESETITVTLAEGYYLEELTCANGYTCSATTGEDAIDSQSITITNNDTLGGGSISFKTKKKSYEVAVTPSLNATLSTNDLSVPYGESRTFTITPAAGYYLTGITCSSGYTCSGYSTGSASDPVAAASGNQTITVTNNNKTGTGAVQPVLSNLYRISFSKTNISSPSEDYVDVAYGGSTTVTVTPASGYYLSAFSGCPSGWTCSGISTGTSYTEDQTLTLANNSSTNTGTLTMTGAISDPWASITTMQGMTATACANAEVGKSKTLTDSRDNNTYTVTKLADGKCWMTQNLRLAGARTLTPSDSNVSSNFVLPASDENVSSWCYEDSASCVNKSLMYDHGDTAHGGYYNWYTATASTGTYAKTSGDVTASLCSKNWRLPTDNEFRSLVQAYGGDEDEAYSILNGYGFSHNGYRTGATSTGFPNSSWAKKMSYYWSSTAATSDSAKTLLIDGDDDTVDLGRAVKKYTGYYVRCVVSS